MSYSMISGEQAEEQHLKIKDTLFLILTWSSSEKENYKHYKKISRNRILRKRTANN